MHKHREIVGGRGEEEIEGRGVCGLEPLDVKTKNWGNEERQRRSS